MRPIKFRGQLVLGGDLINFGLDEIRGKEKNGTITLAGGYVVAEESIQQFTGLLDKNRKEIYEGDVVKLQSMQGIYEVVFEDAGFYAKGNEENLGLGVWYKNERIELVGNIYENGDILHEQGSRPTEGV